MSEPLTEALGGARAALASSTDGHLPRAARLQVLAALGPADPSDPWSYPRTVAKAAIVEPALRRWHQARSNDARPDLLVSAARSTPEAIAGTATLAEQLSAERSTLAAQLPQPATHALDAALALLRDARLPAASPASGDDDMAPEQRDAERIAADAIAGPDRPGEAAIQSEAAQRRRVLWEWWLAEAVPAAALAGARPTSRGVQREQLTERVAAARLALSGAPLGQLPRSHRLAILDALGPNEPADPASYPRTVARGLAIQRIRPLWQRHFPDDDRPAKLSAAALSTQAATAAVLAASGDLFNDADSFAEDQLEAGCVARAASRLVLEAAFGDAKLQSSDDDFDPWDWDSEYHAGFAVAPWASGEQDAMRTREFWTWWLDEAVPAAAEAGLRPG